MDAKKKRAIRYWMVGYQSVSSLAGGGRHRKAEALPLSGMARSEARYSGRPQEVGAKVENVEEIFGNGKECIVAHPLSESQWNRGVFRIKK